MKIDLGNLLKKAVGSIADRYGYDFKKRTRTVFADGSKLEKGRAFIERMRDVVSDPLNQLIDRAPDAGYVDPDGLVTLHNGLLVPSGGAFAYYGDFSDVLIVNRGVHEPLEEFCFQEVLKHIQKQNPVMVELGAYWAHYSMWLAHCFPKAKCIMVEPDPNNLEVGRRNFARNGFEGRFIEDFVSKDHFSIDEFMASEGLSWLDILHSDIQGYEVEMLENASETLSNLRVGYVFVSTHGDVLHEKVERVLKEFGYRIEASSSFENHSTSMDGFVLASNPKVGPVFDDLDPWGRHEIAAASGLETVEKLSQVRKSASLS